MKIKNSKKFILLALAFIFALLPFLSKAFFNNEKKAFASSNTPPISSYSLKKLDFTVQEFLGGYSSYSFNNIVHFPNGDIYYFSNSVVMKFDFSDFVFKDYIFDWIFSSINAMYFWTDGTTMFYSNDFNQYYLDGNEWKEKVWLGLDYFKSNYVWTDGETMYYSFGNGQYYLDGNEWKEKTWTGLTDFNGNFVWTDGETVFFSRNTEQYYLDGNEWKEKTWTGLTSFIPSYVYEIEGGFYDFYAGINYFLKDGDWVTFEFDFIFSVPSVAPILFGSRLLYLTNNINNSVYEFGLFETGGSGDYETGFDAGYNAGYEQGFADGQLGAHLDASWHSYLYQGSFQPSIAMAIWTDGETVFYSNDNEQYYLDGNEWKQKIWTGLTNFNGMYVWTDGQTMYYSFNYNHYYLDGDEWKEKTWTGLDYFNGNDVWTDGFNYYLSTSHILENNQWKQKVWYGLTYGIQGREIWTDGVNIYYSAGSRQRVLNGNTWTEVVFSGYSSFLGSDVWNDFKGNTYLSNGVHQFILGVGNEWKPYIWQGIENQTYFGGYSIYHIGDETFSVVAENGVYSTYKLVFDVFEYDGAFADGYVDGYRNGFADGETSGYENGFADGETSGHENGFDEGYLKGSLDSESGSQLLFLIPSSILGTLFSVAFSWLNFTVLGINAWSIILILISLSLVIFLLKLLLGR